MNNKYKSKHKAKKPSPEYTDLKQATSHTDKNKKSKNIIPKLLGTAAIAGALLFASFGYIQDFMVTDNITDAQRQNIQNEYRQAMSQGETIFTPVNFLNSEERRQAKLATGLPEKQAEELMLHAEGGRTMLGWVTVWDNMAEDGDVVEIEANGLKIIVPILNNPTKIVLPYTAGSAKLTIKGIKDGGGGITVSAKTASGSMPIPPMNVGESRLLTFK